MAIVSSPSISLCFRSNSLGYRTSEEMKVLLEEEIGKNGRNRSQDGGDEEGDRGWERG